MRFPAILLLLLGGCVLLLGGCAVTDDRYPAAWDPLLAPSVATCARFAGSYADKGEAPQSSVEPSLTYGLFGHHSPWQFAKRVDFAFPEPDVLEITVRDDAKTLASRRLSEKAGDWRCRDGRLVVANRRWVAADIVAGREHVTIDFYDAPGQLVARVQEKAYGTIFAVVPIAGVAVHWYRFPRLKP